MRSLETDGEKERKEITQVKNFDFGIIGGLAFEIKAPTGHIFLDLRCSYGLIDMMEKLEGYIPAYDDPDTNLSRNMSVTFSVGYRFQDLFNHNR